MSNLYLVRQNQAQLQKHRDHTGRARLGQFSRGGINVDIYLSWTDAEGLACEAFIDGTPRERFTGIEAERALNALDETQFVRALEVFKSEHP